MEPDSQAASRVDALVAELKARVEERRARGLYPPGLEDDLAGHFRRIVHRRQDFDLEEIRDRLADLDDRMAFGRDRIPTDSRLPGAEVVHRSVAKLVSRQTQGVLEQVQEFADGVREILRLLFIAVEDHRGSFHLDLDARVEGILERLASYERDPVDSTAALGNLRRRVEHLEELERRRRFRPGFSSERFVEEFRGSGDELRVRYRDLAEQFAGSSPVLDIGCGRGEFLELLRDAGVEASGVEVDPTLVEAATALGLDVRLEEGLRALSAVDAESLGGVSLIQVVEHLTPQEVVEVVSLAAEKLRPGGKIIMETVNPQSLYVFAHSFYIDPTHVVPVHPAYLTFLCKEAGFASVLVDWRSPPPEGDVPDETLPDGPVGEAMNENMRRLNRLLFAPQDYAIVATR